MASLVKLLCGLKPTTGCVWSASTLVGFRYSLMSDGVCNQPWAMCRELPHYSCFWLHLLDLGVHGKSQSLCKGLLPPAQSWGQSFKSSKALWGLLPPVSYFSFSWGCLVFFQSLPKEDCRVGPGWQWRVDCSTVCELSRAGWLSSGGCG